MLRCQSRNASLFDMRAKLFRLDDGYHVARHASQHRCVKFLGDLERMISKSIESGLLRNSSSVGPPGEHGGMFNVLAADLIMS